MSDKHADAFRREANLLREHSSSHQSAAVQPAIEPSDLCDFLADVFHSLADELDSHDDEPRQEPGGVENNAPGTTF